MSHADVYEAVSAVAPCAHMEWPGGSAPPLPWAIYYGRSEPICAGDEQLAVKHRWTVELYEARRDPVLEEALGDELRERFGPVTRDESYKENDNMLMVTYTFRQIEGETDG